MTRLLFLSLLISVPLHSQRRPIEVSDLSCGVALTQNANPDNVLILNFDGQTLSEILHKAKTFVVGIWPEHVEGLAEYIREEYMDCKNQTIQDSLLGLDTDKQQVSARRVISTPSGMLRPTHQWIVADFNGDGLPDSIVPSSNAIFIQLAMTNLTLSPSRRVVLGPSTHGYSAGAAADVNGDGKQDLVLCCSGFGTASRLVVALGNGDGTFQTPVESIPARGSFALADWDGDGRPDVITATPANTLVVALGQEDGTFRVSQTVASSGDVVVVGDFTSDDRLDVLALTSTGVSVLAGQANGSLAAAVSTALPFGDPKTLVATDFTGDGVLDVAVFDPNSGVMAMLVGEGDGRFRVTGMAATMKLEGAAAADLDGDGRPELLLPNPGAGTVTMVPVTEQGELGTAPLYGFSRAATVSAAAIADFDGDGKADIAVGANEAGQGMVRIYLGAATLSHLVPSDPIVIRNGTSAVRVAALAAADFDGDSLMDLAVLDSTGRALIVLRGRGDGTFEAPRSTPSGASGVNQIAVGDWNGDGLADVAVSGTGGVRIFTSAGGTFAAPTLVASGFDTNQLGVGDVNGDGKPDLVFGTTQNQQGRATAGVVLNDGSGAFGAAQQLEIPANTGIDTIAAADLNGDGRADILVGGSFTDSGNFVSLLVFLSGEDGAFSKLPSQRDITFGPQSLLFTDINGDGKPDLIAAHCCGELSSEAYLGRGDGTFGRLRKIATAQDTTRLWLADVNGDGVPELVALNPAGVSMRTFRNPPAPVSTSQK